MKTVHEVSELTGLSVRALQYYDRIGLLHPASRSRAGYRLYSDEDLACLQQIMLFRELEFSLEDIRNIVGSPDYDFSLALDRQIELLKLKRERIDRLIALAEDTKTMGVGEMGFMAFDSTEYDSRAAEAKAMWGSTPEWAEYEKRSAGRAKEDERTMGEELMELFKPFGQMAAAGADPASDEATAQAKLIQNYISDHFYTCSNEVFAQLGRAYGAGGDFTRNINSAAGEGAAEFASKAVEAYIAKA